MTMPGTDTQKIETIIDALIDLPSPTLKVCVGAMETAVASHMSKLSATETKLTEAKGLETQARLRAEIARLGLTPLLA
jgi:hypothetical protein